MKFEFRYEAILSYRGRAKEKAEMALAVAQERLKQAAESLRLCETSLEKARRSFGSHMGSGISSCEIASFCDYVKGLERKLREQRRKTLDGERTVRRRLEDLQTKTREYKTIEKLKEKDLEKWKVQESAAEAKWMQEAALVRHGRRAF